MADMTTIKGRIAETIYPNGQGAITAEKHQALLLEMVDDINAKKADKEEVTAVAESVSTLSQEVESNYNSFTKSLDALEQKVDNLPQGDVFDKEGNYPLLHVGTADTAIDLAGRGESVPASFGFRASGGKSIKDGRAYLKRIKGNSVVWNNYFDIENFSVEGGTMSRDGNKIVVTATGEYPRIIGYSSQLGKLPKGNVVLITFNADKMLRINFPSSAILGQGYANGYEWQLFVVDEYSFFTFYHDAESYTVGNIRIIDLTKMFQAGNEPTTIEDFQSRVATLGVDMNAYNKGQVIHCNTESIKSVGDNALNLDREEFVATSNSNPTSTKELSDGMWINGISSNGYIRLAQKGQYQVTANGVKGTSPDASYGVGFPIKVLKGEEYTYSATINKGRIIWSFYNKDGIFLRESSATKVTIDNNCHWLSMTILPPSGDTAIDVQDIMISIMHSGWKQDTDAGYQPYWQDTLPLPIIRKYFPQGMKSAGTAHDEIRYNKASGKWEAVQRIGSVDMGSMAWSYDSANQVFTSYTIMDLMTHPAEVSERNKGLLCSKYSPNRTYVASTMDDKSWLRIPKSVTIKDTTYTDAASFKADMAGVMLYYELAEPIVTELDAEDQNFRDYYNVADFGTEQAIPATDAEGNIIPSAPFSADIIYQFNAVDMIREHELEITELQNVIATMQAQLTSLTNGGQ